MLKRGRRSQDRCPSFALSMNYDYSRVRLWAMTVQLCPRETRSRRQAQFVFASSTTAFSNSAV